ncbi:MAG: hypothetical protein KTR25_14095 [Myxococcales bacterium]|nr:hypothetical protein [Myxococcales bacterium]
MTKSSTDKRFLGGWILAILIFEGCVELKPQIAADPPHSDSSAIGEPSGSDGANTSPAPNDPPTSGDAPVSGDNLSPISPTPIPSPRPDDEPESPIVPTAPTVHLLGEGTMASYEAGDRPRAGWGEMLSQFLSPSVRVINRAMTDNSSRKFYFDQDRWPSISPQINPGDFVLIQFGLSDQLSGAQYDASGTFAYCSDGTTEAETCGDPDHSYYRILKNIVGQIFQMGAVPILVTPVVRNQFVPGRDTLDQEAMHNLQTNKPGEEFPRGNYPEAMRELADRYDIALIDMTKHSKRVVEVNGHELTETLNQPTSASQLEVPLATILAKMASLTIRRSNHNATEELRAYINSEPCFAVFPDEFSLGRREVGTYELGKLAVLAFDMGATNNTLTIDASDGLLLSQRSDFPTWLQSISFDYFRGEIIASVHTRFTATNLGSYNGGFDSIIDQNHYSTVNVSAFVTPTPPSEDIPPPDDNITPPTATPFSVRWFSGASTASIVHGPVSAQSATLSDCELGTPRKLIVENDQERTVMRVSVGGEGAEIQSDDRYIEFVMSAGNNMRIDSLSTWLTSSGGSFVQAEIEYSLSPDFSESRRITNDALSFEKDVMVQLQFPLNIEVPPTQSLYMRIFPFNPPGGSGKYLAIYDYMVEGEIL